MTGRLHRISLGLAIATCVGLIGPALLTADTTGLDLERIKQEPEPADGYEIPIRVQDLAFNEANADIFAEFFDCWMDDCNWLVGTDRWGNTVFQTYDVAPNDPSLGWDGRYQGREMNAMIFVYFAELEMTGGETVLLEGEVLLVR